METTLITNFQLMEESATNVLTKVSISQ